jgi:cell division protein FtsN
MNPPPAQGLEPRPRKDRITRVKAQSGGLVLGLIIGLLVGLALALGVALYVTKAPVPFVNKVPPRTAEQDAVEAERNKTWDPNAPLGGKPVQKMPETLPPLATTPPFPPAPGNMPPPIATRPPPARDPAAILSGANSGTVAAPTAGAAKSSKAGPEPFIYFVQAGAFQSSNEAEQQRARLAMLGLESKVIEREQSGRTVFRVRIGPFERQVEADAVKGKVESSGIEALLVRLDRRPQ